MPNIDNKIQIGDSWKDLADVQINILDSWKSVSEGYVNISNSWKQFWSALPADFYGHTIANSCRFNAPDTAYMHKTPAGTGNRRKWTFSAWFKMGNLGTGGEFLCTTPGTGYTHLKTVSDTVYAQLSAGGSAWYKQSNMVIRDVGSWYHIVWSVDTTQPTASNRSRIYLNGVEITSWSTEQNITQNTYTDMNMTNEHRIGGHITSVNDFDGYMAEVVWIDGTQYSASDFGEFKAGVWTPKDVSGLTYGTNGFHLDFADSANLGNDVNGGTDLTEVNLAATDQVTDSPTNNFCVVNAVEPTTNFAYSEGNLKATKTGANSDHSCRASLFVSSGKWYWEGKCGNNADIAFGIGLNTTGLGNFPAMEYCYHANSNKYNLGSATGTGIAYTTNDIISCALDLDSGKIWWAKNGTWIESGDPGAGTGEQYSGVAGTLAPMAYVFTSAKWWYWNFGQDSTNVSTGNADDNGYGDFEYDVPAGFLALCSANLSDPAWMTNYTEDYVDDGFKVVLYTGNSTTGQSITGVGHQPDMVVLKNRETVVEWKVIDSVRGAQNELNWDSQNDDSTDAQGLTSFDADGFTLGTTSDTGYNENTKNFVSYNWKESATYGFDIVTFEGTGSAHTESHSLGVIPDVMILKNIDGGGNDSWMVYHTGNTAAPETDYLMLDLSNATADLNTIWNDVAPTSSVFTVGTHDAVNASGQTIMAYLFTSIEGFSKFATYIGNTDADGPFVYCGFRPAHVLIKRVANSANWQDYNSAVNTYNPADSLLATDTTSAEQVDVWPIDLLSNGFKLRMAHVNWNASGETYIFMAWSEQPGKYSNSR